MFYVLFSENKKKMLNISTTIVALGDNITELESLEFWKCFDVGLAKFENYQILLIKMSLISF